MTRAGSIIVESGIEWRRNVVGQQMVNSRIHQGFCEFSTQFRGQLQRSFCPPERRIYRSVRSSMMDTPSQASSEN